MGDWDETEFEAAMKRSGVKSLRPKAERPLPKHVLDEAEAAKAEAEFAAAMAGPTVVIDKDVHGTPDTTRLENTRPKRVVYNDRTLPPISAQVDLHGHREEQALADLVVFLDECVKNSVRTAIVVTGKGLHSEGAPVLLPAVMRFIESKGEPWVRHYGDAPRSWGGSGAIVLELKPRRQVFSAADRARIDALARKRR
ncbi:MAG: Smr/MutS family protein [Myxococcales bacterium]|nr:Smr/MutS family protein [Myxococcales bacterium]